MLVLQFSLDINFWIMIFLNEADNSIHFLSDFILRAHVNNVASVLCCFYDCFFAYFFCVISSQFLTVFEIWHLKHTTITQNNNKNHQM